MGWKGTREWWWWGGGGGGDGGGLIRRFVWYGEVGGIGYRIVCRGDNSRVTRRDIDDKQLYHVPTGI